MRTAAWNTVGFCNGKVVSEAAPGPGVGSPAHFAERQPLLHSQTKPGRPSRKAVCGHRHLFIFYFYFYFSTPFGADITLPHGSSTLRPWRLISLAARPYRAVRRRQAHPINTFL
ncbi:hypothetical protein BCV70DRAFT_71287 [Testicularia cyperi]|uniref:Uncharacterized protein n=1 Tax=Testicularia cyperi TaxID=1882483 RepID=A0A317XIT5_9BASI|nr:hypothetical protein BCV70DRAFT_71287 [Testicularia cyperi]